MCEDGGVALVMRRVCGSCDAFLGYSHKEGCPLWPGVVQSFQTTEKMTTLGEAMEHPHLEEIEVTDDMAKAVHEAVGVIPWQVATDQEKVNALNRAAAAVEAVERHLREAAGS